MKHVCMLRICLYIYTYSVVVYSIIGTFYLAANLQAANVLLAKNGQPTC